jgi:hypothetical protein
MRSLLKLVDEMMRAIGWLLIGSATGFILALLICP